jgi:hypothetical protein
MNTRFKGFAFYNILQNLCDFIHVLIFVIVSKCRKSPKLTNIVIPNLVRLSSFFFFVTARKHGGELEKLGIFFIDNLNAQFYSVDMPTSTE